MKKRIAGTAVLRGVFVLAARSAKKVATEQIAGQPTTRYTVTVDLRKVPSHHADEAGHG
jgi:hypothetical protein